MELNAKGEETSAPMKFAKIKDLRILNSIVPITNIIETRNTANTIKKMAAKTGMLDIDKNVERVRTIWKF